MASRVTSIILSNGQLGKIKAVVKEEKEMWVEGVKMPCRVFACSSQEQPDFELIVPTIRNSEKFEGRCEVEVEGLKISVSAKNNNFSKSKKLDLVAIAKTLKVKN